VDLVDVDGNGELDIEEFKQVLRSKQAEGMLAATQMRKFSTIAVAVDRIAKTTTYISSVRPPKDAYSFFAQKGAQNCLMDTPKIVHQAILGGCYVGFGGLLSLSVAGNMPGITAANPGLLKMTFAALFPVNLLLILNTGAQLFTGNSATAPAALYEGYIGYRALARSWALSLAGNIIGCGLFALMAKYCGLLTGGTAALAVKTGFTKCGATVGQTFVKAIMCNWLVCLAVFLAGAAQKMSGKLISVWFPISTFVAIGLEHSVANLFLLPCALLSGAQLTLYDVLVRNIFPVLAGNAVAGALFSGSYSYQFGKVGQPKAVLDEDSQQLSATPGQQLPAQAAA